MTDEVREPWVWMSHPLIPDAPPARVTEEAFTKVWSRKDWQETDPPRDEEEAAEVKSDGPDVASPGAPPSTGDEKVPVEDVDPVVGNAPPAESSSEKAS